MFEGTEYESRDGSLKGAVSDASVPIMPVHELELLGWHTSYMPSEIMCRMALLPVEVIVTILIEREYGIWTMAADYHSYCFSASLRDVVVV